MVYGSPGEPFTNHSKIDHFAIFCHKVRIKAETKGRNWASVPYGGWFGRFFIRVRIVQTVVRSHPYRNFLVRLMPNKEMNMDND